MKRLLLTQIDTDFNPDCDVPIGPWCFQGAENIFPDWEDLRFIDVYHEESHLKEDSDNIRFYAESLIPRQAEVFNKMHDTAYGPGYWRILLLPWVLYLCQNVWCRYRHIEKFIHHHAGTVFEVDIVAEDPVWQCADMEEINHLLNTHEFQFWLSSRIVSLLAPRAWKLKPLVDFSTLPVFKESNQPGLGTSMKDVIIRLLSGGRCRGVYGIRLLAPFLSLFLHLLPSKNGPESTRKYTSGQFEALSRFPSPFVELFEEVLLRVVPDNLGKDYPAMDAVASRRTFKPGKINLVGPVLIFNEQHKFAMAHAVEAGELIVCTQHGGSGFQRVNINSIAVENAQARYFSWGWRQQEDYEGNIVPLPSPFLSRYANRHKEKEQALYFIGNTARVFANRLETGILGGYAIRYRQEKVRFIKGLSKEIYCATRYRPYFSDWGSLTDQEFIVRRFADLSISHGTVKEFIKGLLQCRLAVIDHLSTTFSLAMAANVPVVAFCDLRAFQLSRQAVPIFDRLAKVGIFCFSGAGAAEQVNSVWSDVQSWWNRPEVQKVRREFCESYARTNRFWWACWLKALIESQESRQATAPETYAKIQP